MTDSAAYLPVLADDRWLVKLACGWRLKWIVQPELWGAQWCVMLWRPI